MTPDEALRALRRFICEPWLRLWRGQSPRTRRHIKLALFTATALLASGGAAWADGSEKPASLSWIRIKDSHDISVWQYEMSLDRGGITNASRTLWSITIDICWEVYRAAIALAAWLIDWTLSFEWLAWVAGPVTTIGDSLQSIVDRFGATTALLTISACVAVIWMARGRWALGVFELVMSLVVASLAVGVLANPVQLVAGPNGLLTGARDTGLQLATGLSNGGDTTASSAGMREDLSGMVIDIFLRRPHQLVNFGQMVDGTGCEGKYQDALEGGPYGDDDDLRDAVGDCDDDAGEVAENPNSSMFMSIAILLPAALVILLFAGFLCFTVLIAGIYALVQSLKMIIALVLALLPGNSRGSLLMTLADLVASILMIVASVVFLSAYLLFLQAIFDAGGDSMQTFFIVDLLLVAGLATYVKLRTRIKESAGRMAELMSRRPSSAGPTKLPHKTPFNPASAYYKGRIALGAASAVGGVGLAGAGALAKGSKAGSQKMAKGVITGTRWAAARTKNPAADAVPTSAAATGRDGPHSESDTGSAASRLDGRLSKPSRRGQLARVAAPLALAAVTGGTSAVAHQAVSQVAGSARRNALQSKLRPIALAPGQSATPATPNNQARPPQAPRVVAGEVVGSSNPADALGARLQARRAAERAGVTPHSGAIALPAARTNTMAAPKSPGKA